jgi:signal transduction histidine kinase
VRRQITLLVAATTSIVLLAFLLPAASLVARVAESRALDAAQAQLQFLTPSVGLDPPDQVAATLVGSSGGLDVAVRLPRRGWIGNHRPGLDTVPTSPAVLKEADGDRVVQPVRRADGNAVIEVFVPTALLRAGVTRTWLVLAGLGAVLLLLALLVADRLARSMTRPVTDLASTARRLSAGDLDARTTPAGPAEVRDVGEAVNQLADRIEALLKAEREAAADLAHRLRTPLTALRLDVEGLDVEALPPEARERLTGDVDALDRSIDQVIVEARRSVREGVGAGCDAGAVVAERVRFWSVLAEDERRPLTVEVPGHPMPVRLAAADLAAAVDALLGNVFAHTPEGTAFGVRVRARAGGGALVEIADTGPGLAEPGSALERGHSGGGSTGLGLDIARRTAEASGGSFGVASSPAGTTVSLELGPPAS